MSASDTIQNNVVFQLSYTLTKAGSSVTISDDVANGGACAFTDASIILYNADGTLFERVKGTASGGTLTLSKRGIKLDKALTEDASLKREWRAGTYGAVTVFASDMADIEGDVTINGNITPIDPTKPWFRPQSLTQTQINALPTTGQGLVFNSTLGLYQVLQGGAWVSLETGAVTPDASQTVAGKVELATQTEYDAGTDTGGTGAKLVATPSVAQQGIVNKAATHKTSLVNADAFVISDSEGSGAIKGGTLDALKTALGISSFGSGIDGDVTISSWTTTLSRDMFYNNLTISGTGILNPNGYRVFVKGTLSMPSGTPKVQRNGNAGTNGSAGNTGTGAGGAEGTGGAALNAGSLGAEVGGANGGAGGNGGNVAGTIGGTGTSANPSYTTTNGASGWAGWALGTPGGAGPGGTSTRGSLYNVILRLDSIIPLFLNPAALTGTVSYLSGLFTSTKYKGSSGAGGGGGSAGLSSANQPGGGGGGGGGNGGTIFIAANTFNNVSGTVEAIGGKGGNGGNGSNGSAGAGSGAGGNGGTFILVYKTLTSLGTVTLTGGSPGTPGTGGATGGTGGSGNAGTTIQIQVTE